MNDAAYVIIQKFGHETAHLEPAEQIAVAREVIGDLIDSIIEIAQEAIDTSKADPGA